MIETRSLPRGLSCIVGERSHGHKEQMYEDQTQPAGDLGRLHEGGGIELGLEERRLGQGMLGIQDREELNRAQTFSHWYIWGGECSISIPR